MPFVQLDERLDQCQPESQAALRAIQRALALHKRIEEPLEQLRRDADARVGDFQEGAVTVSRDAHRHAAARGRVLQRIAKQVRDHLLEPCLVGVDPSGRDVRADVVTVESTRRPPAAQHVGHQLGEGERAPVEHDLARGHPAHVEQIIDQPREVLNLTADHRAGALGGLVGVAHDVEHVHGARDRAERIAQLVPEHGQELILRAVRGAERCFSARRRSVMSSTVPAMRMA